jgi:predicted Rdx family selenoprotein
MAQWLLPSYLSPQSRVGLWRPNHTSLFWVAIKISCIEQRLYASSGWISRRCVSRPNIVSTMLPTAGSSSFSPSTGAQLPFGVDAAFILSQRKAGQSPLGCRLRQMAAHAKRSWHDHQSRLDACAQQLNKCIMICEKFR